MEGKVTVQAETLFVINDLFAAVVKALKKEVLIELEPMMAEVTMLAARVDDINRTVNNFASPEEADVTERLNGVEATVQSLVDRLDDLESKLNDTRGDLTDLDNKIDEANLDDLPSEDDFRDLERSIEDHETRIESLESAEKETDISAVKSIVKDTLQEAIDNL